ncbi:VOC family protein [Nocardia veterana]|uniref:Glyoxalase/bleomycin resistance/dioxygenase family protein n=1 Tax=Nocardia veterana TaxID=132249 RepID=A0A7X6LV11_9NOCA|nr:VOC family protein [Nocardia veterana]NKY84599.1 glyoxalase/bleomycin resistance/dioxygenase family protein [Nocardia veterana]
MLRGMTTVSYYADDLDAAKSWYTELLGTAPYFEVPGYLEFRIGDYRQELGIVDRRFCPDPERGVGGALLYWHVDDPATSLRRLLDLGAAVHQPLTERGEGFVTASVVDPFGNLLGIMTNRHYLDVLQSRRTA